MALLPSQLPLLDACHRRGGIRSPVYALGSQQFPESDEWLSAWARERGYDAMAAQPGVPTLFADRYGANYLDFDLNEDAAVQLDLSEPLPPEWRGKAGTVLEAGTLEHIFDVRQAIQNVHDMLSVGGTFVGLISMTWYEHGFFNFNAKLFRAVAKANAWEPIVEGYWIRVPRPFMRSRFVTVLTRDGAVRTRQKLWFDRMMNRVQPARVTYCCCYRKLEDRPFVVPLDIFGNW